MSLVVLLSTYNGESYLEPFLDSLYQQSRPADKIIVRDDGSEDATWSILQKWTKYLPLEIHGGKNCGIIPSYFELFSRIPKESTFISLADQDDVWFPEKLEVACAALTNYASHTPSRPALYCSRVHVVCSPSPKDKLLFSKPAAEGPKNARDTPRLSPLWRQPSFSNALIENIAIGHTIVLNSAAAQLLHHLPHWKHVLAHDWWCYLLVSAFGKIIFDPEVHVHYRQHDQNAVGLPLRFWTFHLHRLQRFWRLWQESGPSRSQQAAAFLNLFAEHLTPEQRALAHKVCQAKNWKGRLRLALDGGIQRQFRSDDILWRCLLPISKF